MAAEYHFYIIGPKNKPASASKFGYTDDLIRRRQELQTGNQDELRFYFHADGTEDEMANMEHDFGEHFDSDYHRVGITGGSEWRSTPRTELIDYAKQYCDRNGFSYRIDETHHKINK